ncbi:pentatricopeptide repeat-containing protein At2g01510, mitochondrial [Salvia hispanica]|uniref:pentatricopeptide repeat-containing protein At2g01510, mitochondrial n=1 Tax=Salvia hispanica TaxID=49212 RepID=UPI002009431F|nr:pentatricopeptide repeat-containing protein At2g01510, mitochondrial [Salvia hispanica]XP_047972589.1 pentatricopeptide repeat-containing protein At2g01510, mitochondrial [Salvia hispanica]
MNRFLSPRGCRSFSSGKDLLFESNKNLTELLKSGRIDDARKLFGEMPQRDEVTWNAMIAGYGNSGRLADARKLFDEAPKRSAITWSSLVSGYCKMGCEVESFKLIYEMQLDGFKPRHFTLGGVLRMCSIKGLIARGKQIHGYAVKTRLDLDHFVVTGLIDVYAKCLCIVEAENLFGSMSGDRNHVTWTAMVTGYSQNGDADGAMRCFRGMRAEGVEANQYTFPGVLVACAAVSDIRYGVQVHSCVVRGGFEANVFVQSALIDMYTKCGDLSSAWRVVEAMEVDDLISCNAMIVGCVRQGSPEQALALFRMMHQKSMKLDEFTYPSVLNSVALLKDVNTGKIVHSLVVKSGFEGYTLVSNALIDMYAKQNNFDPALRLFDELVEKDVISWTSLITGCAHNGLYESSLKLFCRMRRDGMASDRVLASTVMSSCAELALLDLGQQAHANCVKSGLDDSPSVDNSLVSFYAHCGCLEDAKRVFDSMRTRNVVSWTALIVGYAQNGEEIKSLQLYDEMRAGGVEPDYITFIGLLFACSHAGLAEQGQRHFESMVRDYGIRPGHDHYACMIDLLGRSGRFDEAEKLLREMEFEPDSTMWKSLLSACRKHGNLDLAKRAAAALIELEPQDPVAYVLLSNMYSAAGKWEEAASTRSSMKVKGVVKEPGRSWVEMNGRVHTFTSDDRNHLEAGAIYSKVDEVLMLIKAAGYVPDMSFALHDINEEGKMHGLAYHSEKLALAFCLLKLTEGAPVRIYKNVRVCGDCHSAMRFASLVYRRHIVLRDSNRFHHFKGGVCSCNDYW